MILETANTMQTPTHWPSKGSVSQWSRLTGYHITSLYNHVQKGTLEATRHYNGRLTISRQAIETFLKTPRSKR